MQYVTVQEAAARLSVKDQTIRRWVKQGRLKGSKLGRVLRVDESSLTRLITGSEVKPDERGNGRGGKARGLPTAGRYVHLPPRNS